MPKAATIITINRRAGQAPAKSKAPTPPKAPWSRGRPNPTIMFLLRDLRQQRQLAMRELRRCLRELGSAKEDLADIDAAIATLRAV